jgi:hypothetical protein
MADNEEYLPLSISWLTTNNCLGMLFRGQKQMSTPKYFIFREGYLAIPI